MHTQQLDIVESLQGDAEDMSQKIAMLTGAKNINGHIADIIDGISGIQESLNFICMELKHGRKI